MWVVCGMVCVVSVGWYEGLAGVGWVRGYVGMWDGHVAAWGGYVGMCCGCVGWVCACGVVCVVSVCSVVWCGSGGGGGVDMWQHGK